MFLPTGVITVDDPNPVKEKLMSENAINSENMSKPASDTKVITPLHESKKRAPTQSDNYALAAITRYARPDVQNGTASSSRSSARWPLPSMNSACASCTVSRNF